MIRLFVHVLSSCSSLPTYDIDCKMHDSNIIKMND